jgi:ATP-binding cassette subfamily B protein
MFDIGSFLVRSRQSIVMVNRLTELEMVPPMVTDGGGTEAIDGTKASLSFDKVRFGFDGTEKQIVDDISLEIAEGETIALVGKVGSGKSWLINLIPRLVDPTDGEIRIGEEPLKKFSLADLRRNIGYVPQEPVLFSDTVRNNVLFGREDISEETLDWAIEVAQLKDEIATFPKGLETQIGTRGMSISGGQKQRLALARALVGQPRILILDDCTSALDSRTEAALWDRLHEVLPDLTAVVITHRPDTLENADRIVVLDQGRVVESGKHGELNAAEGLYARIYMRYQLEQAVKQ